MSGLMILENFSMQVRFCDFENLQETNITHYWRSNYLRILALSVNHTLIILNTNMKRCHSILYILVIAIIDLTCSVVGLYNFKLKKVDKFEFHMLSDEFILPRVLGFMTMNIVISNFDTANNFVITQMKEKLDQQNIFKIILENLQESIIICSKNEIEYINDHLFYQISVPL